MTEPYKVRDLARMLGCSEQHVRNLAGKGQVPGMFRLGKLLRFRRADVDAWLAARVQADQRGPGGGNSASSNS